MAKIAFTGGGTGGHIYPNLAIIEDFHQQYPEHEIFYLGHPDKLEAQILENPEAKDFQDQAYNSYIQFIGVESSPPPSFKQMIFQPWTLFSWLKAHKKATEKAFRALQNLDISLVYSTGAYVSVPFLSASSKLKIPYIVHNLDAYVGLANKLFALSAKYFCYSYEIKSWLPKKNHLVATGNPISRKFSDRLKKQKSNKGQLNILITGGSQGAKAINETIGESLQELCALPINIIHVTGKNNFVDFKKQFAHFEDFKNYQLLDYSFSMPELCSWADIAICRSGAMTIAEMIASEVVCIFIPLANSAHDHQNANAAAIARENAAISLKQDDADLGKKIISKLKAFCEDPALLGQYKEKLSMIKQANARQKIIDLIVKSIENS